MRVGPATERLAGLLLRPECGDSGECVNQRLGHPSFGLPFLRTVDAGLGVVPRLETNRLNGLRGTEAVVILGGIHE